jgi:delta(3,5)-delta(2,4)-dienoyl-CoA isomerase
MQRAFQLIETCLWPVLVGIHGACIGGAIDLIAACDIAYCTTDSKFSIKEIDIGLAADLGTLNRLPLLTSNWGLMKELALTAEYFGCQKAKELGVVSKIFEGKNEMFEALMKTANVIASKSPIAMIGTKTALNYARTKQVQKGLEFLQYYNMSQIFTKDIEASVLAFLTKSQPKFAKL